MTRRTASSDGLLAGLKRAFRWRWHLLGLSAGVVMAFLSGDPGMWLPVVAAAEVGYMGLLGLNPRFQRILAIEEGTALPGRAPDAAARFQQLMSFLSPADVSRFEVLLERCSELLELRRRMDARDGSTGADDFRGESLDRMLWLFLKLLHQRSGFERFLHSTSRGTIEGELRAAEQQLHASRDRDSAAGLPESRLTASVRERLKTIGDRLDNYRKAEESLELVSAEIDKTEQQITHLCEVGMTMRDSAGLSVQIDSISESLQSSERTFAHADIARIFDDELAPPLLSGASGAATARSAIKE